MEEEMGVTIESYKSIIDCYAQDEETDVVKVKKEMNLMSKQIMDLERERQKHNEEKVIYLDEKKQLKERIE